MKNKIFISVILLFLIVNGYYFVVPLFKSSEKNIEIKTAELIINSRDLINSYTLNEQKSDSLYAGKIIEVIGYVKEITFLNIVL